MIRRWPIRIRLTAAFTVMMALVLAGVAVVTVTHSGASLDASITESLEYRLRDLQPNAVAVSPVLVGGSQDTAEQVLDPTGGLIASSAEVSGQPLLTPAELADARRGQILVDHPTAGGLLGPVRIVAAPTTEGSRIAVAAVSLADRDTAVADLRQQLEIAFPIVLLAAALGAYLLAAGTLRPVERMRARAAAITAEHPEQRLPVPVARDEISRLGATFNDLLARLHTALRRERQFVADASHELRTPLSLLTTELELALRRPRNPQELTAALGSALEETERLSRLSQDLLLLARTDQPNTGGSTARQHSVVELRPALAAAVARYRNTAGASDLSLECPAGLAIRADGDDLDRAVSNLLDNALHHGATPITIHARPIHADNDHGSVAIDVRDHGPGFDPDFLPRAFDRFTRADDARTGGGAGLGLAITAALARRNGGHVTAANDPEAGTVVTLTLPMAPTPTPASAREVR
jgi:signal transduction histidine kinase